MSWLFYFYISQNYEMNLSDTEFFENNFEFLS